MGVALDALQCVRLLTHLWLVLQENEHLNLTSINDPLKAITKHIVDSLLFLDAYRAQEGPYLDMGTGAGYPGIVLEIMDPCSGVLLDSRVKKMAACEKFCGELGLSDVACRAERVEDYAREHRDEYSTITARALAPLGVLLEYAQPLLAPGGRLIAGKGILGSDELSHGNKVAELLGFVTVSRETFELPRNAGQRDVIIFQKIGETSMRLPRRAGMAIKRPL